jgi:hypothetical protein
MSEKDPLRVRAARFRREAREIRARATAEADDRKRAQLLEVGEACERIAERLEQTAAEK